ncbi:MAG: class I SAM-dependent methyltransferase [Methylococcaceae bacterium]
MQNYDEFNLLKAFILRNKFLPAPPPHRNFVSSDGTYFIAEGVDLMTTLVNYGLRPDHSLLDIGCGIGRVAIPLTQYMSDQGSYYGLDINISGIAWCHENLTQKYLNFEFAVINAKNVHYAHTYEYGNDTMRTTSIPVKPGRQFDAACTFSLFTHLLWDDVDEYFRIIASLLKKDGFFLSSLFLINEVSKLGIEKGTSPFDFDMSSPGPTYTIKNTDYSHAIAHDEKALIALAEQYGMRLRSQIQYSGWHEGQPGQDVMVLQKV